MFVLHAIVAIVVKLQYANVYTRMFTILYHSSAFCITMKLLCLQNDVAVC